MCITCVNKQIKELKKVVKYYDLAIDAMKKEVLNFEDDAKKQHQDAIKYLEKNRDICNSIQTQLSTKSQQILN